MPPLPCVAKGEPARPRSATACGHMPGERAPDGLPARETNAADTALSRTPPQASSRSTHVVSMPAALNHTRPPCGVKSRGLEDAGPGSRSATRRVPAAVPSDLQSSRPEPASFRPEAAPAVSASLLTDAGMTSLPPGGVSVATRSIAPPPSASAAVELGPIWASRAGGTTAVPDPSRLSCAPSSDETAPARPGATRAGLLNGWPVLPPP
mmetsp:Transcript_349/g.1198  ORF Transcript_349/g.1198 Transcript_349/m.1198 type:complete len:209 (-) Transcript_349:2433-3059(-)